MNSKKYSQPLIFYFSGTGNAFQVAKWMEQAGSESEVILIDAQSYTL